MLAAHQQVDVLGRRLDLVVEFVEVRFAVPADHHLRWGQLSRPLTGDLQRPDPPSALLLIERLLIAAGLTQGTNRLATPEQNHSNTVVLPCPCQVPPILSQSRAGVPFGQLI
jgi:hypothetical protein